MSFTRLTAKLVSACLLEPMAKLLTVIRSSTQSRPHRRAMVLMLTPAASSGGWDCLGTKITNSFSEAEESRLVQRGLAVYAREDAFGNCWETDEIGIIQIRLLGLSEELIL